MENKAKRIEELKNYLKENDSQISSSFLCEKLRISETTLARYTKELCQAGYIITRRKGAYTFSGSVSDMPYSVFSKADYVSIIILIYIFNNSPCPRSKLTKRFCSDSAYNKPPYRSVRNLDKHLKTLMKEKYITATQKGREVIYNVNNVLTDGMPIKDAVSVLKSLKTLSPIYPSRASIRSLESKLNILITNRVKRVIDIYDDFELKGDFVTVGEFEDKVERPDDLEHELCTFCYKDCILEMNTQKGGAILAIPLNMIYSWKNNGWYMVFRNKSNKKNYHLIRTDNIKSFSFKSYCNYKEIEINNSLRQQSIEKIDKSFGISFDEGTQVEVIFLNELNVAEKAMCILSHKEGSIKHLDDGSLVFSGEVTGIMDFLLWVRTFGSSAVILSPEWLRQKHIESAKKTLEMYGVDYEKVHANTI